MAGWIHGEKVSHTDSPVLSGEDALGISAVKDSQAAALIGKTLDGTDFGPPGHVYREEEEIKSPSAAPISTPPCMLVINPGSFVSCMDIQHSQTM
jgi:hypothetical protein